MLNSSAGANNKDIGAAMSGEVIDKWSSCLKACSVNGAPDVRLFTDIWALLEPS